MATVTYQQIWNHHPFPNSPCDTTLFVNQCAIRMGVALTGAGVNMASFHGAKCWVKDHSPKHILRAQELANWITTQTVTFGNVSKYTKVTSADFAGKTGLVFIKDGWGATDHIDVWNRTSMKAGNSSYFALGKQVWFWQL